MKISLSVKIVVVLNFMCSIMKIRHLEYSLFVMYKMAILSKIKPHSDAVDFFKELPFYNKPIKTPKIKHLKTFID